MIAEMVPAPSLRFRPGRLRPPVVGSHGQAVTQRLGGPRPHRPRRPRRAPGPCGPPAGALQSDLPAVLVIGAQRVAAVELESGDEEPFGRRDGVHSPPPAPPGCPSGVKIGTFPARSTTSKHRPRSISVRSRTSQVSSGARPAAVAIIDSSRSTPTTPMPRRASSRATRPVPQPASSTKEGCNCSTKSASPWTSTPEAASASKRCLIGLAVPAHRRIWPHRPGDRSAHAPQRRLRTLERVQRVVAGQLGHGGIEVHLGLGGLGEPAVAPSDLDVAGHASGCRLLPAPVGALSSRPAVAPPWPPTR